MTQRSVACISPQEAAFVTGLSPVLINKAIDRGEIVSQHVRRHSTVTRQLGEPEVLYLTMLKELSGALQRSYRKRLYRELRARGARRPLKRIDLGIVSIDVTKAHRQVQERTHMLQKALAHVVCDPDIRSGEPVVRGTRVPVYVLADLSKQGASEAELLEDYPSVTAEGLHAAILYATVIPRRGRPKQNPWHADVAS